MLNVFELLLMNTPAVKVQKVKTYSKKGHFLFKVIISVIIPNTTKKDENNIIVRILISSKIHIKNNT